MESFVRQQLYAQGNPNPPGRQVGPGQRMPQYENNGGASWNGAAYGIPNAPTPKTINAHIGMPSNDYITSAHAIRSWRNGEHADLHEGQIMFSARVAPVDGQIKQVSQQHLGKICRDGYVQARRDLEDGKTPNGINITAAEFDALREDEIAEYLGKEHTIPDGDNILRDACRLIKITHFKYLIPAGVMYHWNLWGGINNLSVGNTQSAKVDQSQTSTMVVNCVVGKKVALSNVWGDSKKLNEGGKLGLIVRRAMGEDGMPLHTEIIPWALRDYETPPFSTRGYFDASGNFQPGYYLPIGTATELDYIGPPEQRRRQAIGNKEYSRKTTQDALGSLPKVFVHWGN